MRLYGKRPVMERLRSAPKTIRLLVLRRETDAAEIVKAAKTAAGGSIAMLGNFCKSSEE